MRKWLLLALLLALGCQKRSASVAEVKPTEPTVRASVTSASAPRRSKRVPLGLREDRSMIPLPPPPAPPPPVKPRLGKEEAAAAVVRFLTSQGATTDAVKNGQEAQQERAANVGGGYNDVRVTEIGDPKEYPQVAETQKIGWVVPVSFTASNPRLQHRLRASNHLFLLSRSKENEPAKVYFHGSSEFLTKAQLGEDWYNLNRPPRPETETFP